MGTKNNPGTYDCYASADPDEPMFILLARDPMAPQLVRNWSDIRESQIKVGVKPIEDMAKVREARQCAAQMELWRGDQLLRELQAQKDAAAAAELETDHPPEQPQPAPADPQPAAASSEQTPATNPEPAP